MDYFGARYYSSTQGRFTSPDEFAGSPVELFTAHASANPTFYADITNPQSLNKYTYCLNNPLAYIDPDGHDEQDPQDPPKQEPKSTIDSIRDYVGSLVRTVFENPEEKSRDINLPATIHIDGDRVIQRRAEDIGKGVDIMMRVLGAADPTGGVDALRAYAKNDKAGVAISLGTGMAGVLLGPFGKVESKAAKTAISVIASEGTHDAIAIGARDIIPTRQVAEKLISLAGGTVQRVERAHSGVGYPYPHINYLTAEGKKATIRVQSVGRQFYRTQRKKFPRD